MERKKIKSALISVFHKDGLDDIIDLLAENDVKIYSTGGTQSFIEGKGVVKQSPILLPNDEYNYTSNCFLESTAGSMNGYYKMVNVNTKEDFLAAIPTFQLTTTPTLN